MQKVFKRKINLGQFDFEKNGRCENAASIEIEYRLLTKVQNRQIVSYWEFAASGEVWARHNRDLLTGGQCLDAMARVPSLKNNKDFSEAFSLWKSYHLNGMTAGSPAQESAQREFKVDREKTTWYWYDPSDITENTDNFGRHMTDNETEAKAAQAAGQYVKAEKGDYNDQVAIFLARRGLYTDKGYIYEGKPYKYAHSWLITEIPEKDKARIRALVGITKEDEERAEAKAKRELETTRGAA